MIKRRFLGSFVVLIFLGAIGVKASCPAFNTYSIRASVRSCTKVDSSRRFPFHNLKVFGNNKYKGVILDLEISDFRTIYRNEHGSYTEAPPPGLLRTFYQQKDEIDIFQKGESISGLLSQECCDGGHDNPPCELGFSWILFDVQRKENEVN